VTPPKKKEPAVFDSPFKSADKLFKEDRVKSENQKRFERWMDAMVRERKIPGNWKDDPEADQKVKWIEGKSRTAPMQKKLKS
jgi:hypothetical protein